MTGLIGSLYIELGAQITAFEKGMADFSKSLDSTISDAESKLSGFDKFGSTLTGWGTSLSLAVTAPIVGIGAAAIKASSDFGSAMSRVSALGEITGNDLAKLKKQAEDLGAATQFSSKQAADGMAELAAAGFKTSEIFTAMPAVLNLAAAGQTSIGEAAKIAKDLLGQFGLQAGDTQKVVDTLTAVSLKGSATMGELASSFKYVGPVAQSAGMDLTEVGAALVALDKAGIRGEQAGTSLRSMLTSLAKPSKEAAQLMLDLGIKVTDAAGNFKSFPEIIASFQKGLEGVSGTANKAAAVTTLFGESASSAAQKLISQGAPALVAFQAELTNVDGKSAQVAATLNDNMAGALERMKGSIETAAQKIGDNLAPTVIALAGYLEQAGNKVAEFAGWFGQLPKPVQAATLGIVAFAAAIGPVLILTGQMAQGITAIGTALPLMAKGLEAVTTVTGLSTAALSGYVALIGAAAVAVGTIVYAYEKMRGALDLAAKSQKSYEDGIRLLEAKLKSHGEDISAVSKEYRDGTITQDAYTKKLESLAKSMGDANKPTVAQSKATSDLDKIQKSVADTLAKTTQSVKKLSDEQESSNLVFTKAAKQDDVLFAMSEQLTSAHKKHASAVAELKLKYDDISKIVPQLVPPTDDLTASINHMIASVKQVAPEWISGLSSVKTELQAALKPTEDLDAAYKTLGVNSSVSLQGTAQRAKEAYDSIRASGTASARDLDQTWVAYEKARIDAAISMGTKIPQSQIDALKKMEDQLDKSSTKQREKWGEFGKEVSTVITNFTQDITKTLFEGDGSFADKGIKALTKLGEAVVAKFAEPFVKAAADLIGGAISDLMGGKGFGGLTERVAGLGDAIGKVFGGAGTAASGVAGTVANGEPGWLSGVGGGGSAGGASGSSASGATSGVGGLAGAVNLASGVVSAISSVIGNFQNAHQETSLNAIEHNTRYSMMFLGDRGDGGIVTASLSTVEALHWVNGSLDDIRSRLDEYFRNSFALLVDIASRSLYSLDKLDRIGDSSDRIAGSSSDQLSVLEGILDAIKQKTTQVSITISGADSPSQTANAVAARLQGVFA